MRSRPIAALALVLAAACGSAEVLDPTGAAGNTPVVGQNPGQFGFAVTARGWTADQTYAPDFAAGVLQVGLAGNVVQGANTVVRGSAPFRVRVVASGYTGVISLGVNAGGTAG